MRIVKDAVLVRTAEVLTETDYSSEAILTAAGCAELSWQEVNYYFKEILADLKITEDINAKGGYHTLDRKLYGEELEQYIRKLLEEHFDIHSSGDYNRKQENSHYQ